MKKKINYVTPEVEVMTLAPESGVLVTFSGDGQGTATGQSMSVQNEEDF